MPHNHLHTCPGYGRTLRRLRTCDRKLTRLGLGRRPRPVPLRPRPGARPVPVTARRPGAPTPYHSPGERFRPPAREIHRPRARSGRDAATGRSECAQSPVRGGTSSTRVRSGCSPPVAAFVGTPYQRFDRARARRFDRPRWTTRIDPRPQPDPASSAGRITRATRSARAARNRYSSATGARLVSGIQQNPADRLGGLGSTRLPHQERLGAFLPAAGPPGASTRVDFPAPSGPSTDEKEPDVIRG